MVHPHEHRRVVCGYDIRLDNNLTGLEAVHSRWHAYDGLDEASNGPALYTLHDRAFDLGINLLMHGPKSDLQPVGFSIPGGCPSAPRRYDEQRPDSLCLRWCWKQMHQG